MDELAPNIQRTLTIPKREMEALFPIGGDLDHWWSCEKFVKEVQRRAERLFWFIGGMDKDQAQNRINITTGMKWLAYAKKPKYQTPGGWKLFLDDALKEAQGFEKRGTYESAMNKAGISPLKYESQTYKVDQYASAKVWANAVLRASNREDHMNLPEDIEILIEQQEAGIDMNMTPSQEVTDIVDYYKEKRIACGKKAQVGMGEDGVSGILGCAPAKYLADGHTFVDATVVIDAKMNPLIEAYENEKAKAEQPPKPLDDWFPREEKIDDPTKKQCPQCKGVGKFRGGDCSVCNSSGKIDVNPPKASCPVCNATGEQDGRKCTLCGGDGWVYADEVNPTRPKRTPNDQRAVVQVDNKAFWAKLNGQLNKYDEWRKLTANQKEEFVHTVIGHVRDYLKGLDNAVDACKDAYINLLNGKPATPKQNSLQPENQQDTVKKAEISTEAKIDADVSEPNERREIERSSAASQPDKSEGSRNHMEDIQIKNTHFESPVCVYPHDHGVIIYHGVKYVVTTREGATPAMVLDMLKSWDEMISSGVFEIAPAGRVIVGVTAPLPTVASQPGTVAAMPQTPGVQTAQCVMIKAILSYEGQKPQLEFVCNGMDKSLKFTKPVDKQLGLLTGIRKMDGSAFAPNDLQPNMMYPGNWLIDWKYSEDGKFRNVLAIRPALAQAA